VRRRRSHILQKIDLQMAEKLSALRAGRASHQGRFLVKPRAIVRLQGLGELRTIKRPHQVLNPRSFGLYHSGSTNREQPAQWIRKSMCVCVCVKLKQLFPAIRYKPCCFSQSTSLFIATFCLKVLSRQGRNRSNTIILHTYICP
jgi:hypothetical protein